jgi:hypothetical protein
MLWAAFWQLDFTKTGQEPDLLCKAFLLFPAPLTTTSWLPVGPAAHRES